MFFMCQGIFFWRKENEKEKREMRTSIVDQESEEEPVVSSGAQTNEPDDTVVWSDDREGSYFPNDDSY